jgi:hypothetical protein
MMQTIIHSRLNSAIWLIMQGTTREYKRSIRLKDEI